MSSADSRFPSLSYLVVQCHDARPFFQVSPHAVNLVPTLLPPIIISIPSTLPILIQPRPSTRLLNRLIITPQLLKENIDILRPHRLPLIRIRLQECLQSILQVRERHRALDRPRPIHITERCLAAIEKRARAHGASGVVAIFADGWLVDVFFFEELGVGLEEGEMFGAATEVGVEVGGHEEGEGGFGGLFGEGG